MIHMIWSILTITYNQFNAVSSLKCNSFDIPINPLQFKPLVLLACQKSKCIWRKMSIFVYFINLGSSRNPFWDWNGGCIMAEWIHSNAKCRIIAVRGNRSNKFLFPRIRHTVKSITFHWKICMESRPHFRGPQLRWVWWVLSEGLSLKIELDLCKTLNFSIYSGRVRLWHGTIS